MQTDIIIVGTGISAKLTALYLNLYGFSVINFSNQDISQDTSNLVTFLSSGSIKFLSKILGENQTLNQYENINQLCCIQYNQLDKENFQFYFDNNKEDFLGKIIPNHKINELLDKLTHSNENTKIIINEFIQNLSQHHDHIEVVTKSGKSYSAKLIIFADGKNSMIKKYSDFQFITHDFEQTAISIKAKVDRKNQNIAFQYFTSEGPLALLPYNKSYSSIVWSLKKDSYILKLSEKKLQEEINNIVESKINDFVIDNLQTFDLSFSFAKKLFSDRIAITGDTAHSIHPIAGQGLNLIIKDIDCLTKQLMKYKTLGYDLGDSIALNEYNNLRKSDNVAYSFGTIVLDEIFSTENRHLRKLTSSALMTLNQSTKLKNFFVNSATGYNYFKNF
tara:strand:- start:1493 stop:2662 length:1170 start_codon:yes stop_codon:yes gene_type:complete